ncbi:hypothetical protein ACTMTI_19395 [Nonomuraea sp. H19]|uniref:hypothetical protein n=1 Tax=Nonomuraea sp. H19 TaxID=3452206 RepID=UPI003F89E90C
MWIAVAVAAAIVVGVVVWWLRRDPVGGDAYDIFEIERKWDWELLLTPEAEAAFVEGLRAYHEAGNPVRVGGEQGVLTAYDPPRLLSLHLLAGAFAARGDAAMHDPQGTVAEFMAQDAERPGVLHLRPDWLIGEVDGMDRTGFADAVHEIVCPPGGEVRPGAEGVGALQVRVRAAQEPHANTMMLDLARVLDRYVEARDKQPEATAGELLRDIVPGMIAAGGPGVTWARPPTPEERQLVLAELR